MNVIIDQRAQKEIKKLNQTQRAKTLEYIVYFEEYGFGLNEKYLKKVDQATWELRPGNVRLFLVVIKPNTIVIHAMVKKSQKITRKTKQIINQRRREWTNEIK